MPVGEASEAVLVEQQGRILIATINRPEARNAVNQDVADGLGRALDRADRDDQVWAFIVTGAGDRAFCAGADLKAARGGARPPVDPVVAAWGFGGYVRHYISKPTIAAVNGFAMGGGLEIALASDLVVAADTATFGLPEVKRGILAAAGGAFRLPAQIPPKIAMEMMLTGEPVSAARAHELGLVNRVVPLDRVVAAALELAEVIGLNAPLSVRASKRIARSILDGQVPAEDGSWDQTQAEMAALSATADAAEGRRAFAEKRPPDWRGR
jgi:crotonobetainyl-CoA hydratase